MFLSLSYIWQIIISKQIFITGLCGKQILLPKNRTALLRKKIMCGPCFIFRLTLRWRVSGGKIFSLLEQTLQLCSHSSDTLKDSLENQGGITIQLNKTPFTAQKKAQIMKYYRQTGSVRLIQRWVCRIIQQDPPHASGIS